MKFSLIGMAVASVAAIAFAAPAAAQTYTFSAMLTGAAETPAVTTTAGGSAVVVFNTAAHSVSVAEFFFGLTTPATASHIHCCTVTPLTGTAPVFLGFTNFPTSTSGQYNASFSLATIDYTTLLNGALAGKSYVNIHDVTYPGGEILGYLNLVNYVPAVPEPATYALMLAGVAFVGWRVRGRG